MKKRKSLWRPSWFSCLAEKHSKEVKTLEPGVTAVQMDQEDLHKNRTRAAAMGRDMPQSAEEPKQGKPEGKDSWKATPVEACPKCGSNNVFVTASGKWCRNKTCGHKYGQRTEVQFA